MNARRWWIAFLMASSDAFTSDSRRTSSTRLFMSSSSPPLPQLDMWKLLGNGSVIGVVSDHPDLGDGDIITTSAIVDPSAVKSQAIVETMSGSRYRLLSPMPPNGIPSYSTPEPAPQVDPWLEAAEKYDLTSATIGLYDEYLLAGKPVRSTSGKFEIWEAYRAGRDGLPADGKSPVCIKLSSKLETTAREYENYRKIDRKGRFVECYEFFPVAGYGENVRNKCALVLEMGTRDLRSFLGQRKVLRGFELRDAAVAAARCVQAAHRAGLVWTDVKTENFVVMADGQIRGVDLESAVPAGRNPVDFSPEACPPEFAEVLLSSKEKPEFPLEYSYDIWSLGMMFLELSTGRGYFDGKDPAQITKMLREPMPIEFGKDDQFNDLIKQCLRRDPYLRPTISQVLKHPYMQQSPFGGFYA